MARAIQKGQLIATGDGRPYLVYGVNDQIAHCMPVRSNGLGVGCLTISGRVMIFVKQHDAADMFYVDTVPRRHFRFDQIDRIGRVESNVLADVAEEIARQRQEAEVRFAPSKSQSVTFAPLHLADCGGPSPDYLRRRAEAEAQSVPVLADVPPAWMIGARS